MQEMQRNNGVHMEGSKTTKRKYTKRQVETGATETMEKRVMPMAISAMKPLRCIIGGAANIKDRGPFTGNGYTFHPGQITYVDERDYSGLLARRTNPKRCCGGKSPATPQPLYGVA